MRAGEVQGPRGPSPRCSPVSGTSPAGCRTGTSRPVTLTRDGGGRRGKKGDGALIDRFSPFRMGKFRGSGPQGLWAG